MTAVLPASPRATWCFRWSGAWRGWAGPSAARRASSGSPAGRASPPARARGRRPPTGRAPAHVADGVVHAGPGVAVRAPAGPGTVRTVKSCGRDVVEDVPADRHRHRRAGQRPRAVRRGDGAVPVGLVEVDEDPLAALLLPPGGGDLLRHTALELAGDPDDGVADVEELVGRAGPGRRRARPGCRRSWPTPVRPISPSRSCRAWAARTASAKSVPGCGSRSIRSSSGRSLSSVLHRPGVEGDGVHLHRPHGGGDLVDDQLGVAAAGGVGAGHRARPRRVRRAAGSWRRTPRRRPHRETAAASPAGCPGRAAARRPPPRCSGPAPAW